MKKALICIILVLIFVAVGTAGGIVPETRADSATLTDEQKNAIAMLNYITVLTQEINASKNSRLFMEEAYSSLINNTYPNAVDSRTQSQLSGLLDIMESYRMISVKRERLQFIYEQNQAQSIRAAVPNPLALLSGVQSYRPGKLAAAILYMAVDSATSYMAYTKEADLEHIKDGWALDDEEAQVLHQSRKGTFTYMISMVRDNNLPGDLTLTEETVDEFVKWKNNSNVAGRIRFLESNRKTYQSYGGYWLTLAESYYSNKDYKKCIEAVLSYESLGTRIFRKDYEYAKVLPLVVSAADLVCNASEYEQIASKNAQTILDNTGNDDWTLRYFAAQTYVDLFGKTNNRSYLRKAYDIALDNVNYLIDEQRSLNSTYLSPIKEVTKSKDANKQEKKQIDEYNKMLKKKRETELPPVYEPLRLNCDLLFALANKLGLSYSEKTNIEAIIHKNGDPIFLTRALDNKYWFTNKTNTDKIEIEYGGTAIILPAEAVTENAKIVVTVKEKDATSADVFTDWLPDKVKRENEGEISSFQVAYVSEVARSHKWQPGATIHVEITPKDDADLKAYSFDYTTEAAKSAWYDYFKVGDGHKNNWYDYLKFWENSVKFVKVEK